MAQAPIASRPLWPTSGGQKPCPPEVGAYLLAAEIVAGPLPIHLREVNQPVISTRNGSVANFAHVVVKESLPLSVGRLGGQGVEQFGRSEPLVSGLEYHLFFLDHVYEFDANQRVLGCRKRFEP